MKKFAVGFVFSAVVTLGLPVLTGVAYANTTPPPSSCGSTCQEVKMCVSSFRDTQDEGHFDISKGLATADLAEIAEGSNDLDEAGGELNVCLALAFA